MNRAGRFLGFTKPACADIWAKKGETGAYTIRRVVRIPVSARSEQVLILFLPWRGDEAEEYKGLCARVHDVLGFFRRDEDNLPRQDRFCLVTDMHLPGSFEDVVEFCGTPQGMRKGRFPDRDDRMGDAAPQGFRLFDLGGMQEFTED